MRNRLDTGARDDVTVRRDRPEHRRVVRRLLALDEAGTLASVHVRIAAEAAGVSARTVWRWLAQGREGHVEPDYRRGGFALDEVLWARLEELGGNVAELHRELERAGDRAPLQGRLPSLATMHRAVRGHFRAGRVLKTTSPRPGHVDPDRYDRALAELALPGTVDETGQPTPAPTAAELDTQPTARPSPFAGTTRLYTPGAHMVSTQQVADVAEALAHTIATALGLSLDALAGACAEPDPGAATVPGGAAAA
jgi:hypothetical protein